MTDRVRSLLQGLTIEDRNGILQELLVQVLAALDGERAVLDANGDLVGYLLPVAERLKLEARTVDSLEVFQREADKDERRYSTEEVLNALKAE
jgi:hypothetical protein